MKRLLAIGACAVLAASLLGGGQCERYERKMQKMQFRKHYIDSMRRVHQAHKDSLRKERLEAEQAAQDSTAADSLAGKKMQPQQ